MPGPTPWRSSSAGGRRRHGDSAARFPSFDRDAWRFAYARTRVLQYGTAKHGRDQVREGLRRRVRRLTTGGAPLRAVKRGSAGRRTVAIVLARACRARRRDERRSSPTCIRWNEDGRRRRGGAARSVNSFASRGPCPAIAGGPGIEWRTHSAQPHGAGHQLRFDSADEGAGADVDPKHPLCSLRQCFIPVGGAGWAGGRS